MKGRSIEATNAALRQLGDRWSGGEIGSEEYLAQMYRLIATAEGQEVDDTPSEQQTHPGLAPISESPGSQPRWLWVLPVVIALVFLAGLAWLLA